MTTPCTVYFTDTNPQTSVKGTLTEDQKHAKFLH